jgi:CheY-like chemotaxis protein
MVKVSDRSNCASDSINGAVNDDQDVYDPQDRSYVLIIDDAPGIQEMLCRALELAGYRASAICNGPGALAWADHAIRSSNSPALILLDLSIPSMNDGTFLQQFRAKWNGAPPIIVLTTSAKIHDDLAGIERVICKPFHICDLLSEVAKAMPLATSPV